MERLAVIGNGVSIAANGDFRLDTLTNRVRDGLAKNAIGERSLLDILQLAGKHLFTDEGYDPNDFEDLLGPMDRLAETLTSPLMDVLADLAQDAADVTKVAAAAKNVYTRSVATVLKVIDSIAAGADHRPVRKTVDWLTKDIAATDIAHAFTLNYDVLLDGWFFDAAKRPGSRWNCDDEFAPIATGTMDLGKAKLDWIGLRPRARQRLRNVHLYHLHGGLHWGANEEPGKVDTIWKARHIGDVRTVGLFDTWISGDVRPFRPHVLLTDQKTRQVATEPFASNYEALAAALLRAERVVIAGYGFGDRPLNRALREGFRQRPGSAQWLIVSHGAELRRRSLESEYASRLGCTRGDIRFCWDGLPAVADALPNFWK